MYPTASSGAGLNSLLGGAIAGTGTIILFLLAVTLISAYVNYLIMKAAVRNGVIEALKKSGKSDSSSSSSYIQGYPPVQTYGAPPAPASEHSGYSGPTV